MIHFMVRKMQTPCGEHHPERFPHRFRTSPDSCKMQVPFGSEIFMDSPCYDNGGGA